MKLNVCGVPNPTSRNRGVVYDSVMLKEDVMTYTTDTENSFPYVLLCSLAGTLVALAGVWIGSVIAYAPALIA